MARFYSKKHGKAKSRKPAPENVRIPDDAPSKTQIEELIMQYAKQGLGPALIGEKLKNEHNVPYIKKMLGKSLVGFLKEKGMTGKVPADMLALMGRAVRMRDHLTRNKQDTYTKTRLHRVESKIWRLTKYYVKEGSLPRGWKYDPAQAALLIKGSA